MIKRAKDVRPETTLHHKGGKGSCIVDNVLEANEMHGTGRCYGVCTIPVGSSIGIHQHVGDFETYYILKGKARYMDGDEDHWVEIGVGDVAHCPDGGWHSIENIGDEDLVYFTSILYSRPDAK